MENQLIYIFDDFNAAERARDELINYGFGTDAVNLAVSDDEAGPVQGNFTVGDNPEASGGSDYQHTFAHSTHRGVCMLTIAPTSNMQSDYAVALLARYGVTDATGQDRKTKTDEAEAGSL
ncbi:MAG TPA: hypothetical protein VF861_05245 [Telluria sp.]